MVLGLLVAAAPAAASSCDVLGAGCNGTACGDSLLISFDGGDVITGRGQFDGGTVDGGAPPGAIEIDIAAQMNQAFVPLDRCWLVGPLREVVCDDQQGTPAYINGALEVPGSDVVRLLQVTISVNGTQLSQQTIAPTYVSESCACGAGTASHGTATIQLPPS